jgi:hypothetical protein
MRDDTGRFGFPLRRFIKSTKQGQSLVLADAETRDEMQLNGRWIASDEPAEVRP